MPATPIHLEHFWDVIADIKTDIDLGQAGMVDPGVDPSTTAAFWEWCWANDDKSELHFDNRFVTIATDATTYKDKVFNDITANSDIYVSDYIYGLGDTDTYLHRTADAWDFAAGGISFIQLVEDTADYIGLNVGGNDIDVRVYDSAGDELLWVDAGSKKVGIGDINAPARKLEIADASGDAQLRLSNAADYWEIDETGYVVTTASTALSADDNKSVGLGNDVDLQIYHNGTDSLIENYTGKLKLDNSPGTGDIELLVQAFTMTLNHSGSNVHLPDDVSYTGGNTPDSPDWSLEWDTALDPDGLILTTASNFICKVGDESGVNYFAVWDSNDNEVIRGDSNGNLQADGTVTVATCALKGVSTGVLGIVGTAADNSNNSVLGFYKSDGTTRVGYIGDASSDADIYLAAEAGKLRLLGANGEGVMLNGQDDAGNAYAHGSAGNYRFLLVDENGNVRVGSTNVAINVS